MSKSRNAIAVIVVAAALSSAAPATARGLGPLGIVRFGLTRLLAPGLVGRAHAHHGRSHFPEGRNASVRPQNIRDATNPQPGGPDLTDARLLTDPAARGQIAATAALALWHGDRHGEDAWWSHGHGGYGWVGPLFWPFAYDDIYDYAIFGEAVGFFDYGYPDIYAGIFAPYGYDDLAAYMAPGSSGRPHPAVPSLQQLCGENSRDIAGLPIGRIEQAIRPTEAQRAALNDLANASISAAQIIQASCPTQAASTAPARLALMQQRIEAMTKAVLTLEPPLEKLYGVLDDGQKARLNALAADRHKAADANATRQAAAQVCKQQSAALQWPADEIEARLHPTDSQRGVLQQLQRASARAVDILNDECRASGATTLPERLFAADERLDALQQAVNLVSAALEDFYATLSDEQKAQFEAIGPKRTA